MTRFQFFLILSVAAAMCSCSSTGMPRGTSRGYSSAHVVAPQAASATVPFVGSSEELNRMVQDAITAQFAANGLQMLESGADLEVLYVLVVQNGTSITVIDEYFGRGRSTSEIMEAARANSRENAQRLQKLDAGTIVIDVADSRTGRLIFRNYATRDILAIISNEGRRTRINQAVTETLAPFFR